MQLKMIFRWEKKIERIHSNSIFPAIHFTSFPEVTRIWIKLFIVPLYMNLIFGYMIAHRHVHFTVQIRNDLVCGSRPFRIASMDWLRAMGLALIYPILLMGVRNWVICWGYKRERIRLEQKKRPHKPPDLWRDVKWRCPEKRNAGMPRNNGGKCIFAQCKIKLNVINLAGIRIIGICTDIRVYIMIS